MYANHHLTLEGGGVSITCHEIVEKNSFVGVTAPQHVHPRVADGSSSKLESKRVLHVAILAPAI